jgi:hypothetical protein
MIFSFQTSCEFLGKARISTGKKQSVLPVNGYAVAIGVRPELG